jgi:hypothetical protein
VVFIDDDAGNVDMILPAPTFRNYKKLPTPLSARWCGNNS